MAISRNNFTHVTNTELEGVEVAYFTVDFINSMAAETGDPRTGAVGGLELVRECINSYVNILGEGPLADSNTQKTYFVRADALGTLVSGGTLQTAIRALNGNASITATISSATVTATNLGILTAAVI